MKKVLILVLSHTDWPYNVLEKCIRETWGKHSTPNVEIYYSHGNGGDVIVEGDTIKAPYRDDYWTIGYKTITAFEYFLNKDFDYIFRPNTSSFVNIPKLLDFLNSAPDNKFYSGSPILYSFGGVEEEEIPDGPKMCCSGCGYILSRDLVEMIVKERENWEHRLVDDLALCKFLHDRGVEMVESSRITVHYVENNDFYFCETKIDEEEILNNFHITARCAEYQKNKTINKEHNCEIIKGLYSKIYEA